ncbi:MAG: hypothetical protein LC798_15595 [Chloroflexi bacterium]|nr:hypothetical protein [Chloroflexota bacterium]
MTQAIFGPNSGAWEAAGAVIATLTQRLPTYTQELALRRGVDPAKVDTPGGLPIRTPLPIARRKTFAGWPKTALPFIQVTSPGTAEAPRRDDLGVYTCTFQIEVFVVCAARDHNSTAFLTALWGDAIVWTIMQRRTLGGIATSVDWLGSATDDVPLPDDSERTLQGFVAVFAVEVPGCLDPLAGPSEWIPDNGEPPVTYPPDVIVTDVRVEFQPE